MFRYGVPLVPTESGTNREIPGADLRNDHLKREPLDAHFDRGLTNVFAIGINVEGRSVSMRKRDD